MHTWKKTAVWLERYGIDCSRRSNEDDVFVFAVMLGVLAAFFAVAFSTWLSGFIAGVTVFSGASWIVGRFKRLSSIKSDNSHPE